MSGHADGVTGLKALRIVSWLQIGGYKNSFHIETINLGFKAYGCLFRLGGEGFTFTYQHPFFCRFLLYTQLWGL